MKKLTFVAALLALSANAVQAQEALPKLWVSTYFQMYTSMGGFVDPDTNSRWFFGDNAFGLGAAAHYDVSPTLTLGLDLGYTRPSYERTDTARVPTETLGRGDARVFTLLATGRMASGGAGSLGFYLTGGVGAIAYRLDEFGDINPDLALRAGTGLEYRWGATRRVFLEWGRFWGFHEKAGLSGGRVQHSNLEIGFRGGF
jgi:hypothetical protein